MLTAVQREILDFEMLWWHHGNAKEAAIRSKFGVSPTRYYQLLHTTIHSRAALEAEPHLVKRLLTAHHRRAAARARHLIAL